MIKVGTDIVEISRFSDMKREELFKKRIFTERENEYFGKLKNPYRSIAGAFAAKEAFSKYIGTGIRGFEFSDIEVLHNEQGKPYIEFKGRKIAADVSISHSDNYAIAVVCGDGLELLLADKDVARYRALIPKRDEDVNKGDCGRVFVVAGSVGMLGAACLSSKAAIRSGSGLVTLGTPEAIQPYASIKLTEVMACPLKCRDGMLSVEAIPEILKRLKLSDVCAIGPGLGRADDIFEIINAVINKEKPCVIDADGINALAKDISILKDKKCDIVLTPHPGEMSRLTGLSIDEIQADREKVALEFAKEHNVVVLLKGHRTVVASPDGDVCINETGNSAMASGGMGDVLTGVIASFIGQGVSVYDSAVLGAYLHGLAGDIAAYESGKLGVIAGDVEDRIPYAIKLINNE